MTDENFKNVPSFLCLNDSLTYVHVVDSSSSEKNLFQINMYTWVFTTVSNTIITPNIHDHVTFLTMKHNFTTIKTVASRSSASKWENLKIQHIRSWCNPWSNGIMRIVNNKIRYAVCVYCIFGISYMGCVCHFCVTS